MSTFENSVFCTRCSTRVQAAATCSNCGADLQDLVAEAPKVAATAAKTLKTPKSVTVEKPDTEAPREPVVKIERKPVPAAQAPLPDAVPTNVLAIVSLVLSILGFCFIASILGHIALSQIKKTGEQGRGLAIAGIVVGYVATAAVIGVVALVAIYISYWNSIY